MAKKEEKKLTEDGVSHKILIEPWITEEATRVAQMNKYIFKVFPRARKEDIKKAVESVYKVNVISVNTIKIPGKKRVRGRVEGKSSSYKKAVVRVKEGEQIEFFEGK
jgi:large subunit ribosomal protein L23